MCIHSYEEYGVREVIFQWPCAISRRYSRWDFNTILLTKRYETNTAKQLSISIIYYIIMTIAVQYLYNNNIQVRAAVRNTVCSTFGFRVQTLRTELFRFRRIMWWIMLTVLIVTNVNYNRRTLSLSRNIILFRLNHVFQIIFYIHEYRWLWYNNILCTIIHTHTHV
jgi:hypothetical protein